MSSRLYGAQCRTRQNRFATMMIMMDYKHRLLSLFRLLIEALYSSMPAHREVGYFHSPVHDEGGEQGSALSGLVNRVRARA